MIPPRQGQPPPNERRRPARGGAHLRQIFNGKRVEPTAARPAAQPTKEAHSKKLGAELLAAIAAANGADK